MTTPQFFLVLYLCSFVCSWAGVYLSTKEAIKQLRKEGYSFIGEPLTFISTIAMGGVFLIPIVNTIMALNALFNYDHIVNESVRKAKEEGRLR